MDDLDRYTDYNGSLVLDLCDEQNLIVVTRENKCHGQVTWQCVNGQSCIDYALVSEMVYEQQDQMIIDENVKNCLGSDHRGLALKFGRDTNSEHEPIASEF